MRFIKLHLHNEKKDCHINPEMVTYMEEYKTRDMTYTRLHFVDGTILTVDHKCNEIQQLNMK